MTWFEILKKARQLITPPGSWTRFALARDAHGATVPPLAGDAAMWCASGACERAALGRTLGCMEAICLLNEECRGLPRDLRSIVAVNDSEATCHGDVLAIFDRVIARKEAGA
jgi:hypothetical protein